MLIFPLKVAPILEAIIKGAIISLIRMGWGFGEGGGGREARGGVWGIKQKIQDPLLPEKNSQDQDKCGCMLCKKT